ncbi:YqjF family protein [Haloarchaeobius amylolyticus]|uniref:YqjF family protein n=1 Tax=Haloarchaeobius amylolyticus TaxID=1198296 RepID=A0ABD6BJ70_9EURY
MTEQRTDPFRWTFAGGSSPNAPHVAAMTWRDGLFVHWPVDPDALRPHVPGQLTLETRDGHAWVGVLPFVLTNVGIRGTPSIARLAFGELNVRTYVRYQGDPGLFFFSIDVGNSLVATAVGRATRLPVYDATIRVGATEEKHVTFTSDRQQTARDGPARFAATYRPDGEVFTAEPDTLAYWLTARRRFYAPSARGVLAGEIAHDPWPLQPAAVTIHENTMFEANDLPRPTGDPVVHYADDLSMTGSIPRRLRGK